MVGQESRVSQFLSKPCILEKFFMFAEDNFWQTALILVIQHIAKDDTDAELQFP